jgi:hypothetical protein
MTSDDTTIPPAKKALLKRLDRLEKLTYFPFDWYAVDGDGGPNDYICATQDGLQWHIRQLRHKLTGEYYPTA